MDYEGAYGSRRHDTYESFYGGRRPTKEESLTEFAFRVLKDFKPDRYSLEAAAHYLVGKMPSLGLYAAYRLAASVAHRVVAGGSTSARRSESATFGDRGFKGHARKLADARHAARVAEKEADKYYAQPKLEEQLRAVDRATAANAAAFRNQTWWSKPLGADMLYRAVEDESSRKVSSKEEKGKSKWTSRKSPKEQRQYLRDYRRKMRLRRLAGLGPGANFIRQKYGGRKRNRRNWR